MKCPECKVELGNLFVKKDGKIMISGKWAFHLYDTHGFPIETTEMVINGQT